MSNCDESRLFDEFMTTGYYLLNQIFNTDYRFNNSNFDKRSLEENIDYATIIDKYDINFVEDIISLFRDIKINKVEFDKDNDDLKHVDLIVLLANMRNIQYGIDLVDKYNTRKISGNIIPALITTTAIVAGFQILEFIKIIKFNKSEKNNIENYKNRFVNTSINYCDGITPYTPKFTSLNNKKLSLWDRLIVNTTDVHKILKEIEDYTNNKVEYLTWGNEVIYDGDTIFKSNVNLLTENLIALIGEDFTSGIDLL